MMMIIVRMRVTTTEIKKRNEHKGLLNKQKPINLILKRRNYKPSVSSNEQKYKDTKAKGGEEGEEEKQKKRKSFSRIPFLNIII